jgi:hypothetical protein
MQLGPAQNGGRLTSAARHIVKPFSSPDAGYAAALPAAAGRTEVILDSWRCARQRGACRPKPLVTGRARGLHETNQKASGTAEYFGSRRTMGDKDGTCPNGYLNMPGSSLLWDLALGGFLVDIRIRGHSGPPRRPILLSSRNHRKAIHNAPDPLYWGGIPDRSGRDHPGPSDIS